MSPALDQNFGDIGQEGPAPRFVEHGVVIVVGSPFGQSFDDRHVVLVVVVEEFRILSEYVFL